MTGSRGRVALLLAVAVLAATAAAAASLLLLAVSDTSDEPVGRLRPRGAAVAVTEPPAEAPADPLTGRSDDDGREQDEEHGEDADD
ncbi:MAG: hypothetical protein KJ051_08110 [Thermoleophilia bacterium]|nr:hypothetical protein [Thermoleophilia bacterium]